MQPGDRGRLDVRSLGDGTVQGFFVPKEPPAAGSEAEKRLASGVKLIEVLPASGELRIYPTETRSWDEGFLGPKYAQIMVITLPTDAEEDADLADVLESLPSGLTKDYEYGLGLIRECNPLVHLIEENTACDTIALTRSGATSVDGSVFRLSLKRFDAVRAEFARIKNRGDGAIHRVKRAYVHNNLADVLGIKATGYSMGRHSTTQWISRVAAGTEPRSDEELDDLVSATSASATEIAARRPVQLARLQRDIELVNLDQLIDAYRGALGAAHKEAWWQQFFEANVFVLQMIFGGPTVFVDSQVPIGEGGNAAKGKKIADYLFRNPMTSNAALVEIKKPRTRLMNGTPYRAGVYGVHSEISKSVTQVLDQALQLTRHAPATQSRTPDDRWQPIAPRCFVVAGIITELDTPDKLKSFELYREHLSGVRLVTYDEILEQLVRLREFLRGDAGSSASGPGS